MFSGIQIPFSLDVNIDNLFWKELHLHPYLSLGEPEPLQYNGLNDVVSKISELAARIACDTASSERNVAEMIVRIERRSTLRHEEFVRLASSYSTIVPYIIVVDDDEGGGDDDADGGGDDNDDDNDDDVDHDDDNDDGDDEAFNWVVGQSLLESGSVATAVEDLVRLRYKGSSGNDDESKEILTCVICMEEAMIGSQIIGMPCSRMFYQDCNQQWLT